MNKICDIFFLPSSSPPGSISFSWLFLLLPLHALLLKGSRPLSLSPSILKLLRLLNRNPSPILLFNTGKPPERPQPPCTAALHQLLSCPNLLSSGRFRPKNRRPFPILPSFDRLPHLPHAFKPIPLPPVSTNPTIRHRQSFQPGIATTIVFPITPSHCQNALTGKISAHHPYQPSSLPPPMMSSIRGPYPVHCRPPVSVAAFSLLRSETIPIHHLPQSSPLLLVLPIPCRATAVSSGHRAIPHRSPVP